MPDGERAWHCVPEAYLESQLQRDGRLAAGTAAQKNDKERSETSELQRDVPLRPVRHGVHGHLCRAVARHPGGWRQSAGISGSDGA